MTRLVKMTFLMLFIGLILATSIMVKVNAEEVGVSEGNTFEYDMVVYLTAFDSPPADLLERNQTKSITVTVLDVSGSNISMRLTTQFQNGSEITADGWCDIETGQTTGLPFIGANLQRNDAINPSADEPWYVNETVTRNYKDGPRDTNHLKLEYTGTTEDVGEVKSVLEYYFDKSTGAVVEYTTQVSYIGFSSIIQSKLISSNVWSVSGEPSQTDGPSAGSSTPTTLYIATAVIVIIIAVIAILVMRRKKAATPKLKAKKK